MKKLLSLLLCFVFLHAQTFAKHELPGSSNSLKGVYGGVMIPTSTTMNGVAAPTANALGIFAFAMPSNGYGAGSLEMFTEGTVYNGTIDAMGNTDSMEINAILTANYNYAVSLILNTGSGGQSVQTQNLTASATGSMKAKVNTNDPSFISLKGTAFIQVSHTISTRTYTPNIDQETDFEITGQLQTASTSVSNVTRVTIP